MFDVREKPKMVERAFLLGVQNQGETEEEINLLLNELDELVDTLEIGIIGRRIVKLRKPQARFLMGTGKVEEILNEVKALGADCIVFDCELSPAQQRNWEKESGLCVIDRQEVILDIFSERAQTKEAVLQVELARAEHSLPRLKNAWTHLSRQRGGGGVTQRGEGEAQIELDQRMVRIHISKLKKELADVVQHRKTQRKQRQKLPVPTAAIVGYTNAGKSTLLNALTGSSVLAEDKLFATLDPTTRQLILSTGQKILVTDTVGFVRRLPHRLVNAFRATLEEAVVANFLIHVVDMTNPESQEHEATTMKVLKELGADEKQVITVYNKVDQAETSITGLNISHQPNAIYLSAKTGLGIDKLMKACEAKLEGEVEPRELLIPHDRYDLIHKLHLCGAVKNEKAQGDGVKIVGNIPLRLLSAVEPFKV